MSQKTYSTILEQEVKITRKGWNHIISGRNIRDKHLRLTLLKPARFIIKNASEHSVEERNGVEYHILKGELNKGKIKGDVKVILRKDVKGNYYFYSVMKA